MPALNDPTDPSVLIASHMLATLLAAKRPVARTLEELERRVIVESTRLAAQTQLESPAMKSTPLPKAHIQKVQQLTNARAEAEAIILKAFGAMLAVSRLEKEEQDLHQAARAHDEERFLAGQASGLYQGARSFVHKLGAHGVNKNHLERVSDEIAAVIADLIRWAVADPEGTFDDSPLPALFGIYAERSITRPDFRYGNQESRHFSKPGAPGTATDVKRDPFYRYVSPPDHAKGTAVEATVPIDGVTKPINPAPAIERSDLAQSREIDSRVEEQRLDLPIRSVPSSTAMPLGPAHVSPSQSEQATEASESSLTSDTTGDATPASPPEQRLPSAGEARAIATKMVEVDQSWQSQSWPPGIALGETTREVLLPALEAQRRSSPVDLTIPGFLQAAREDRIEAFLAMRREARIADLAAKLERGAPLATAEAQRLGLL